MTNKRNRGKQTWDLKKAQKIIHEAASRPYCLPKTPDPKIETVTTKSRNANNRRRGKEYERRVASALGGTRNLDKARPHTDVETGNSVYEIKSSQAAVPQWLLKALSQLELASEESEKDKGGVVKVYTKGAKARAFLIKEIELL